MCAIVVYNQGFDIVDSQNGVRTFVMDITGSFVQVTTPTGITGY